MYPLVLVVVLVLRTSSASIHPIETRDTWGDKGSCLPNWLSSGLILRWYSGYWSALSVGWRVVAFSVGLEGPNCRGIEWFEELYSMGS